MLEHTKEKGFPLRKESCRREKRTQVVFTRTQVALRGSWKRGKHSQEHGVFRSVVCSPPRRHAQVAQSSSAGGAGTIRILPSEVRQIHAQQPVLAKRKIHAKYRISCMRPLRQVQILSGHLYSAHNRRGVGPELCGKFLQALGFLFFLLGQRPGPQPRRQKPGLATWSSLSRLQLAVRLFRSRVFLWSCSLFTAAGRDCRILSPCRGDAPGYQKNTECDGDPGSHRSAACSGTAWSGTCHRLEEHRLNRKYVAAFIIRISDKCKLLVRCAETRAFVMPFRHRKIRCATSSPSRQCARADQPHLAILETCAPPA